MTPHGQIAIGAFGADGGYGELYLFSSISQGELLSLVNDQSLPDANLQACVLGQAASNGWATVDEVTALNCASSGITDVTGLDVFDSLQTVDLTDNPDIACDDLDSLEMALPATTITRAVPCDGGGGDTTTASVQNLHNAMGQRAVKTVNGDSSAAVHFIYDQAGQVIAEIDAGTGQTLREYVYVNGQQVALVDDTGTQDEATYFVHNDHLGTPQKITDASQNVVWAGSYEPFGEVSETVATIDNNIRFPGQYEDEESRLHYNYFRDYDPTMGRYIESDPLGLSDGLDTYSYAWQNPLSFIDPEGTAVPIAVGIGIRIVLSQSARKGAARVAGAAVGALFGRGNYTCVVKCNGVQITGPGRGKGVDDCGTDCPETVTGTGAGRTPREAWRNAFRAADRDLPVGCQKRHCRGIGGSCLGWR